MRTHGKRATYVNADCRCDECRQANTAFQRERKQAGNVPPGGEHGLSGYNNFGCRCRTCTEAKQEANAAYWPVRRSRSPGTRSAPGTASP